MPVTDLNFIPEQLIDRVEVLTGGASAVYGSDAIAGVVNFITLKNFEGIRLDAQISGYQHDNGNNTIQDLNTARNFDPPTGSTWDGRQTSLEAILGVSSPDGKGNIEAYFGYRNIQPITQNRARLQQLLARRRRRRLPLRGLRHHALWPHHQPGPGGPEQDLQLRCRPDRRRQHPAPDPAHRCVQLRALQLLSAPR